MRRKVAQDRESEIQIVNFSWKRIPISFSAPRVGVAFSAFPCVEILHHSARFVVVIKYACEITSCGVYLFIKNFSQK